MNNIIPVRIFDFLKNYPPFSLLEEKDLMHISEHVVVKYCQSEEVILQQGHHTIPYIYVVREGAVRLYQEAEQDRILIDECDEGDVFGLRPLVAGKTYKYTAVAAEESLLYGVKTELIEPLLENYPELTWYLSQGIATGVHNKQARQRKGRVFHGNERTKDDAFSLIEIQSIEHSKKPVTCLAQTSVQEAARMMQQNRVGSIIIVDQDFHPSGILTDRDLRNKIVTGVFPLDIPVSNIMSKPVITIRPQQTAADVQIMMMKHNIHHLCLTENGGTDSKVLGIISEHDLLVLQANNPAILIREMKRCRKAAELKAIREKAEVLLKKYLLQEVSINFICNVMTEINDAMIARSIELCLEEMESEGLRQPDVQWCWMTMGSQGRGEQLLRTDQDSALVFENVAANRNQEVKGYFLMLAGKVTSTLHACGFAYCPGDMMASNPEWCKSLDEWKAQFTSWILEPTEKNIMLSNIFFDYRFLFGEQRLAHQLTDHIFTKIEKHSLFIHLLAKDALKIPPPLTFFRNFVVEKSGEHKNEFDIKGRAMMPLADAARVLILDARIPRVNSTFHRFDKLAAVDKNNRELFEEAADAYEILVRYRAMRGLENNDSGRYFKPSELTKMERMNLRNSFRPISELHDLLRIRYRLGML